ncbi:MAG: SCP2 sterol-binding domain-containing protein [Candidatus Thermoplasmatota archaeon]|jgi:putative sterol carrier protein|nr:SCP2 sterol-binding domain-containing protein [Candidatus Thermoplasmatota archaeon]MCL5785398.1 SCP2 sterol-binding domain-containing protein [Candidatus Thermoplasmatota archaeon]
MTVMQRVMEMVEKMKSKPEVISAISGTNKSFQFDLADGEKFYVEVSSGNVSVKEGTFASPSATIQASPELLGEVLDGKTDPVRAFMSGKLKVKGDIFAAQKITDALKKA